MFFWLPCRPGCFFPGLKVFRGPEMSCSKDSWKVRFATWVARWNLWRSGVSVGGAAPVPPLTMGNRPVVPSTSPSPLARQAARNLYSLEILAQRPVWTDWFCRRDFWRTRRMMAMTPDEAAAWLPAVAVAVQRETGIPVLEELTHWPIPEPLPPEAVPWRTALIRSWERHPAETSLEKAISMSALMRLNRRAERLPEWLAEARRAMDWRWEAPDIRYYSRYLPLVTLAGWRPLPGARPPHMDRWIRFWEQLYRTPTGEGIIAAAALLNLAEGGWLPSGPSPERLREEFHQRVQQWPASYDKRSVLRMLLASVPADASVPEQQWQDIMAWLELTHENVQWQKRELVWEMLAAWQREGVLEWCGIDREELQELSLLPHLARTLEWELDSDVLLAMAGYIPGTVDVSAHPEAIRAIIARWEALSRNDDWQIRQAAWVGRWNLMRAGAMTAEEQTRFGADYVDAIRSEKDWNVLLTLVQIRLPGLFPLKAWTRQLSDQKNKCRQAARLAIHGWLVEVMERANGEWEGRPAGRPYEWRVASGSSRLAARQYGQFPELPLRLAITRRQMWQVLRRAGREGTDAGTVAPFVNLPPEVLPDLRRLQEIETALAAGQLPLPSPDTGTGNRPMSHPRPVPSRLPETHPRTDPPGITDRTTGRTAGSESPARHPFPEVIRHE